MMLPPAAVVPPVDHQPPHMCMRWCFLTADATNCCSLRSFVCCPPPPLLFFFSSPSHIHDHASLLLFFSFLSYSFLFLFFFSSSSSSSSSLFTKSMYLDAAFLSSLYKATVGCYHCCCCCCCTEYIPVKKSWLQHQHSTIRYDSVFPGEKHLLFLRLTNH